MAKSLILSRYFPVTHPRAGQPTFFVEKFLKSGRDMYPEILSLPDFSVEVFAGKGSPAKLHTIRAGFSRKLGEAFSPRVWSGVPYYSKQVVIGPDQYYDQIMHVEMKIVNERKRFFIEGNEIKSYDQIERLASNDGLSMMDFFDWFPKPFTGQLLCWSKKVKY